jgi:hypothetical protein
MGSPIAPHPAMPTGTLYAGSLMDEVIGEYGKAGQNPRIADIVC